LQDTTLIFTKPGADPGADTIYDSIVEFCKSRDDSHFFPSLGTRLYLSCIKQVDGVLGNSSSGITEVPSFRKGTINVGSRQKGRIQAKSVINCEAREEALKEAIQLLYSPKFQSSLSSVRNPYGEAGSSIRIHKILKNLETQNLFQKKFFDR
jgi:GDP/UDP-N,N'-diacetylbacillosamine 2-epimerase (hydrolysing)